MISVFDMVENIVEKGENAANQKPSSSGLLKLGLCCKRLIVYTIVPSSYNIQTKKLKRKQNGRKKGGGVILFGLEAFLDC